MLASRTTRPVEVVKVEENHKAHISVHQQTISENV